MKPRTPPARSDPAAVPPAPQPPTLEGERPARVSPLASLVRAEALRDEAAGRIRPDPARLHAGWERRFVIERARAADLARLYVQAGFEVEMDPVPPELLDDECIDCRLVVQLEYVSLYTRKAGHGA
jgi:hypothetical protein